MGGTVSGPYASANGQRVTTLDLARPFLGLPVADVALATGAPLASPVSLVVGNLTLAMAVMLDPFTGKPRVRTFAGVTHARLVGGAGTWSTRVTLAPYKAPPGAQVMLSTVLRDVAMATGSTDATRERVRLAAGLDRALGAFYVPEGGAPAGRLLATLAGALWWMDAQGVTQIAKTRTAGAITTPASLDAYDGGRAWLTVATEDLAGWRPGATYSSPTVPVGVTVEAVRVRVSGDGVGRVEALVA